MYRDYIPKLERNLTGNIIPFWLRSLDRESGGYLVHFDHTGTPNGATTKGVVTQARLLWLFSRLKMREAADSGYQFLTERLRDRELGGFYWEVNREGSEALRNGKHLYGQAFALYALAEYARFTQSVEALQVVKDSFALIEANAHDEVHGGYFDAFNRDWSALPHGTLSYAGTDASFKSMNTHLHLLEAFAAAHAVDPSALARQRIKELIEILSSVVIRKARGAGSQPAGACAESFTREWRVVRRLRQQRVSYGHDIENVWLVIDACRRIGTPIEPAFSRLQSLFEYAMNYGFDFDAGGFYASGPLNRRADSRDKIWWVEAEGLVSALTMHGVTNDPAYLEVFARTYDLIERDIVDWTHGEWHARLGASGVLERDKGDLWKAGYHNGRAMLECIEMLTAL